MEIRKAKKSDFESIFRLEKEWAENTSKKEKIKELRYKIDKKGMKKIFLRNLYRKDKLFLVLEDKTKVQGFLFGYINKIAPDAYTYGIKKIGYLENVYIDSKYRRKGYFNQMMSEFYSFLKNNKIKYCALSVELTNKTGLKAYEKNNFKPIEYKMIRKI